MRENKENKEKRRDSHHRVTKTGERRHPKSEEEEAEAVYLL
jgi:hypothetical protein